MTEINALFDQYKQDLEDFWGRRLHRPSFRRQVRVYGRPVQFASNHQGVLDAVDHSLPLYSVAPPVEHPPFFVQIVVQAGPTSPGPLPENLFDHAQYTGEADWLMIRLGAWGYCHMDLSRGRAIIVLTPELAGQPHLVSLCFLNTLLTNYFIANGFAMLHASCLLRDGRALLLMAPHNAGKSTTALRLALEGYQLLSDSMIFLSPDRFDMLIMGFPVGKIKLRRDMVDSFPKLRPHLQSEQVRGEIKYSLDLRRLDSDMVCETAASPEAIDLCLLTRSGTGNTHLEPANRTSIVDAVIANSLFYDTDTVWRDNLELIQQLLEKANFYHLTIGTRPHGIVEVMNSLQRT